MMWGWGRGGAARDARGVGHDDPLSHRDRRRFQKALGTVNGLEREKVLPSLNVKPFYVAH